MISTRAIADTERRAVLAELAAIEAALDVIEQRFGSDAGSTETRARTQAVRVQWLAQAPRRSIDALRAGIGRRRRAIGVS